jgi:hypothetical protein
MEEQLIQYFVYPLACCLFNAIAFRNARHAKRRPENSYAEELSKRFCLYTTTYSKHCTKCLCADNQD